MKYRVKLLGLYRVCGDTVWLCSSGSEMGFSYSSCSSGRIVLHGDGSVSAPNSRARYAVYLNDRELECGVLDREEKEILLPPGEKTGGKVRVVKLSEGPRSSLGAELRDFDGRVRPLPEKKRKLEFIGDSITCGYGADGNTTCAFSTATEDIRASYAYIAASLLRADACYSCYSGFGLASGYTADGTRNARDLVPLYWKKLGPCDFPFPDGERAEDTRRDLSAFRPDTVVINLGTNDISYTGEDAAKQEEYRNAYIAFLETVRDARPEADILCVLGVMGDTLNSAAAEAVRLYSEKTGDTRVRFSALPVQRSRDGYGVDFHPSPRTQLKTGRLVARLLRG